MTRITHPDIPGSQVDVPESSLPHHRAAGWITVEEAQPAAVEQTPAEATTEATTEDPAPRRRATTKEGDA